MISSFKISLIILFLIISRSFPQSKNEVIIGTWLEKETNIKVTFYLDTDNCFYGKVIEDPENISNNNQIVFHKLIYSNNDECYVGTMTPPEKDIELSVKIYSTSNNILKVVAKKFIFSKTLYFQRLIK